MQALAKQKAIPNDYPVPCLVKTDTGDITEISLAENVQHEAMHPADEFVAFAMMGYVLYQKKGELGIANVSVNLYLDNGDRSAPAQFNDGEALEVVRRIDVGMDPQLTILSVSSSRSI